MSKFLAAGISQNKTSILETADRPDLSALEQPTCFWATTTPRCTFQQSKHQKWKKKSGNGYLNRSLKYQIGFAQWCWHSLRPPPPPYLLENPKREIWHRSSDFWNLVPRPKMSANREPLTRAIFENLSKLLFTVENYMCNNLEFSSTSWIFWPGSSFNIWSGTRLISVAAALWVVRSVVYIFILTKTFQYNPYFDQNFCVQPIFWPKVSEQAISWPILFRTPQFF